MYKIIEERLEMEKWKYCILLQSSYNISEVVNYHLKVYHDKLKMYTMSPKAANKITKQRIIANKPTDEIRQNHKK